MQRIKTALIVLVGWMVPFGGANAQQVLKRAISVPTLSVPGFLILGTVLGVAGLVARARRK